jgi:hypothetical protein
MIDKLMPAMLVLLVGLAIINTGWDLYNKAHPKGYEPIAVTDKATGCQYIYGGGFGIVPRVNGVGDHICDEDQE